MALIEACAIISITGSLFLAFLGYLLVMEYPYIDIQNISYNNAGITCAYASAAYLIIFALIICKLRKKKTASNEIPDTGSDSSDEDKPFISIYNKKKRS